MSDEVLARQKLNHETSEPIFMAKPNLEQYMLDVLLQYLLINSLLYNNAVPKSATPFAITARADRSWCVSSCTAPSVRTERQKAYEKPRESPRRRLPLNSNEDRSLLRESFRAFEASLLGIINEPDETTERIRETEGG